MIPTYYIDLACYNRWANSRIISWCENISEEQWKGLVVSSFPSIYDTLLHIVGAESKWHERLTNTDTGQWLPDSFQGSKDETLDLWRKSSNLLVNYCNNLTTDILESPLSYSRINGDQHQNPTYAILTHIFNHTTYHRGQLVTMLRQVGCSEVSGTDYLFFLEI